MYIVSWEDTVLFPRSAIELVVNLISPFSRTPFYVTLRWTQVLRID